MQNPRTILIAEDNPNDVELILDALMTKNLVNRVEVVSDGVEVLEYLRYEGRYKLRRKELPALVLMDLKMPRMTGIDALKEIREDKVLRRIPIVMLTSSREEPDLKKCYELGVNAYVVKPVDFQEFVSAITKLGVFWALTNELP